MASLSRVRVCGRPAARYAAGPLGSGRSLVSSLARISTLLCHASPDRRGLHPLRHDCLEPSAILLMVRHCAILTEPNQRTTHRKPVARSKPMNPISAAKSHDGLTLRQAALVAGFAYLFNPVSYAEVSIYPKLVAANNAAQTVQNISAHLSLFAAAILCYIASFIGDVILACALYVL